MLHGVRQFIARERERETFQNVKLFLAVHVNVVSVHDVAERVLVVVDAVEPAVVDVYHHHLQTHSHTHTEWTVTRTHFGSIPVTALRASFRSPIKPDLGTDNRY